MTGHIFHQRGNALRQTVSALREHLIGLFPRPPALSPLSSFIQRNGKPCIRTVDTEARMAKVPGTYTIYTSFFIRLSKKEEEEPCFCAAGSNTLCFSIKCRTHVLCMIVLLCFCAAARRPKNSIVRPDAPPGMGKPHNARSHENFPVFLHSHPLNFIP